MKPSAQRVLVLISFSVFVLLLSDVLVAQAFKLIVKSPTEMERTYRVKHATFHHALQPGTRTYGIWGNRRYPIETNSLGFKDREVRDVALSSDARRVVFIGDSFTEGIGVEYPETFVGVIGEELGRRGIETLNASMSSYAPSIYYSKIRYLLEETGLEFDELFVFIDISDIEDDALFYRLQPDGSVVDGPESSEEAENVEEGSGLKGFLKRNSVIIRLADAIKDRYVETDGWDPLVADTEAEWERLATMPRASWTFDDAQFARYGAEGLERSTAAMDALDALLRSRDIELTVAVYPWPAQILKGDLRSRQVTHWEAWAREHERGFIDLFPAFIEADEDPRETVRRLFIPWDVHWNEAGHALMAREVLAHLDG